MSSLLRELRRLLNLPEPQELEKELSPAVKILVGNDALAFFDVNNPATEPTYVADIKDRPMKRSWGQLYNLPVVGADNYFRINDYEGPLNTTSVTTPCIVFCAYTTDENGEIKSSGVYHAKSLPPTKSFQESLYKLIDTVRSDSDKPIIAKGAGNDSKGEKLQEIRNYIINCLDEKGVEIQPEQLLLGKKTWRNRIIEFYPLTGQLITFFRNGEQKTIL